MSKRLAIVGTCPSSKMLAPYGDAGVDIWACSPDNAGGVLPRITRFFEIHGDLSMPGGEDWSGYIDWLNRSAKAGDFELVVQDRGLFPHANHTLPADHLIKQFGRLFFSSTPAWMMALALAERYTEIGLFGLDMSSRHEYVLQRPGMQHFIELAEQQYAVRVYAPMESDILQPPPLYGYNLSTPFGRKLEVRRRELMARLADLDNTIAKAQHDRAYLSGALDDIDYQQQIWTGDRDPALAPPERATAPPAANVVNLKGD